jgi:hypothetical protein
VYMPGVLTGTECVESAFNIYLSLTYEACGRWLNLWQVLGSLARRDRKLEMARYRSGSTPLL